LTTQSRATGLTALSRSLSARPATDDQEVGAPVGEPNELGAGLSFGHDDAHVDIVR
jgi:hypothetical protein